MPNWPPDPNKRPDNSANQPTQPQQPSPPSGQEWKVLENTLLASVVEQRRARRWSIFFKLLTFGYILLIFLTLGRGCSSAPTGMDAVDTSDPHLAVVELQGVISNDDVANAYDVNEALRDAFANSNSKAVALDINSPGGSPVQSDEIWQTMMDLRQE